MDAIDDLLQSALDHRRAGRLDRAEALYRQVLQHDSDHPAALNNLGTLLLLRGEFVEARTHLEHALRLRPDYAEAHNNLGSVRLKLGLLDEAHASFARALERNPGLAVAWSNLGTVLHKGGRLREAEGCLQQALRLAPGYAPAFAQLGAVLKDASRLDEARACLERALRLAPGSVETLAGLATVLGLQGRAAGARAAIGQALAIRPADGLKVRAALMLPVVYESLDELERERRRLRDDLARLADGPLAIDDPAEEVGATPFFLAYQGEDDRELLAGLAGLYRRAAPSLEFTAPHCLSPSPGAGPGGPIRVGFLSTFFRDHTIGKLNLGFVQHLARGPFAVTLLRFPGPDDALSRAFDQSADRVVTLPRDLGLARREIADERLDVLHYADVGMDPLTTFLAFARLAPVQCASWGHPSTTGIPTIDHFLSSTHLEPEGADSQYTETLVRFDKINTFYREPKPEGPPRGRADLGLDPDATLYACPQSLFKLHPSFDSVLGEILRGDPRGRLVLIAGICDDWSRVLADRFHRAFPDAADRVVFLPRLGPDDFLHLLAAVDVVLDPFPFGGGSTSYEAFAFGTPIVTRPGRFLRGRIAYACYRQMGLADGIAADDRDYVRIALRLGTDRAWRAQVRSRILARKHLLFEDAEAVRELERFFVEAVGRARRASAP